MLFRSGVFVLEHANVNVVRDALQAMLGSDKPDPYGSSNSGGVSAAGVAPVAGVGVAGLGAGAAVASTAGHPLAGLIRVFPVERLNALVVVTPRSHLLTQVETWIRRLDSPSDALEANLFVYPVQNGSASHLAEMLNGLFGGGDGSKAGVAAGSAPTQFAQSGNAGATGVGTGAAAKTGAGSSVPSASAAQIGRASCRERV